MFHVSYPHSCCFMFLSPQQIINVFASWWIVNIASPFFFIVQGLPIINVTLLVMKIMEFTSLYEIDIVK